MDDSKTLGSSARPLLDCEVNGDQHKSSSSFSSPSVEGEEGLINETQAISNLTNAVIGVGVLSIPWAFRLSGYISLVLILVTILVTSATAGFIGSALDLARKCPEAVTVPPQGRDFSFLAQIAFGGNGRMLIGAVTILEIWFALITFMVMNGVNAQLLWPSLGSSAAMLASCALMALNAFASMKTLSYLSLMSSAALFSGSAAVIGAALTMPVWSNPYDHLGGPALVQIGNVPRSIGIIVFCFAGHPCFPMVHQSMRNREQWLPCVGITFSLAFAYYGFIGTFGYLVFGEDLRASFTQNLNQLGNALVWRNLSACGFLIKIQLTSPMLLKAIMAAAWPPSESGPEWSLGRIAALWCLAGLTAFMAIGFADDVATVASLTGSLFTMTTSVIFPAAVHAQLMRRSHLDGHGAEKVLDARFIIHGLVLMFGFVMAISGTALAVVDIMSGS